MWDGDCSRSAASHCFMTAISTPRRAATTRWGRALSSAKKDLLARAGRLAMLGRRAFGVRENDFEHYIDNVRSEGQRALKQYGMLVVPGAEITQNRLRGRKNSHIIALDIKNYISADQSADDILRQIRRQGGLSIACHPHHRTRDGSRSAPATCGITASSCRISSTSGKRPIAMICFP